MKNLINNNTDLIVSIMAVASIALTFMKIMDVKDFFSLALMILGYKFAKNQTIPTEPSLNAKVTSTVTTTPTSG